MEESIIINERFIKVYDIANPLQQRIQINGKNYPVIGVIRDFLTDGLFEPIQPVILKMVPDCARTDVHNTTEVFVFLEKRWKELFPYKPFEGYYQDNALGQARQLNKGIRDNSALLALFALFLTVTGLY